MLTVQNFTLDQILEDTKSTHPSTMCEKYEHTYVPIKAILPDAQIRIVHKLLK